MRRRIFAASRPASVAVVRDPCARAWPNEMFSFTHQNDMLADLDIGAGSQCCRCEEGGAARFSAASCWVPEASHSGVEICSERSGPDWMISSARLTCSSAETRCS